MSEHADDTHVVAELLATELSADPQVLRDLVHLLFRFQAPECAPEFVPRLRQIVQLPRGSQFVHLQVVFRRWTADDNAQMVRRARTRAQQLHLFFNESHQTLFVEQCFSLLEQECLVGTPAALGDEDHVVLPALHGLGLELPGQVGLGVQLLVHVDGCHLRIPQVGVGLRVVHPLGDLLLVASVGQHQVAFLAHADRGACVLARRQHFSSSDASVFEQF